MNLTDYTASQPRMTIICTHTHTAQHSENLKHSHNYITSKDFPSSAMAVNVLDKVKKLIGKRFLARALKAHIM